VPKQHLLLTPRLNRRRQLKDKRDPLYHREMPTVSVGIFFIPHRPMNIDACFKIAYVMKTHGLKGEVTLALLPECPELNGITTFFLDVKGSLVPHFLQNASVKGSKAYVKWEGIDTPEAAAAMKGLSVYLPKKMRPSLPKGDFYSDEVIGFDVEDSHLGALGKVTEIQESGLSRHLVVDYLGKEVMIPLNGPFIKTLNRSKKHITVELPDGFLDL
jgi:16S rRNA processing protein RimM